MADVVEEPEGGVIRQDGAGLVGILDGRKGRGNSLVSVEHAVAVMRHADWLVDIGPGAGEHGGGGLYSGPPDGLAAPLAAEAPRPRPQPVEQGRLFLVCDRHDRP